MNQGDFRDAIECGCCFATYPFEEMVQCVETHLFCSGCMNSHASILLGAQNPDIRCVDQSGCTAEILPSQLRRVLSPQTMELWERVKQRQDLDAARLENLQCCPFCDWGCIIEDDPGEILMCRNKNVCGVKSCRWCKKLDHRPKVCAGVFSTWPEELTIDAIPPVVNTEKGKHHVDEAMSGALVRRCPGCKKPFIKESGCNKMMCPYSGCGTFSCYICRQVVKGYDHFDAVCFLFLLFNRISLNLNTF
ncbi:hypothetical protein FPV67DRAFT_1420360 [Lyophyllum atratum]|nr:hypothetical protein FPV67DRAFT_1420360 [Lyophyllum atratum]